MNARLMIALWIVTLLFGGAFSTVAQDETSDTTAPVVTEDDVNSIAKGLYCPVCENIPLDTCGTSACEDWRNEIRLQLEAGRTEQEIVDDFVNRFGDRVVGTPQDPVLRALSLVTPWLAIAIAAFFGVRFFLQYRVQEIEELPAATATDALADESSAYKLMLEQDISG